MKNLLVIFFALISVVALSCRKDKSEVSGTVYRGVVVDAICGNIVIQTVGAAQTGQDSWVDCNRTAKPELHHVFALDNPCDFNIANSTDTFKFVIGGPKVKDCAQCMAALSCMPDTRLSIQVVN